MQPNTRSDSSSISEALEAISNDDLELLLTLHNLSIRIQRIKDKERKTVALYLWHSIVDILVFDITPDAK